MDITDDPSITDETKRRLVDIYRYGDGPMNAFGTRVFDAETRQEWYRIQTITILLIYNEVATADVIVLESSLGFVLRGIRHRVVIRSIFMGTEETLIAQFTAARMIGNNGK